MKKFDPMEYNKPRHKHYTDYNKKLRKARKEYECSYCGKTIKKGEMYEYSRDPTHESFRGGVSYYITNHKCINCVEKVKQ